MAAGFGVPIGDSGWSGGDRSNGGEDIHNEPPAKVAVMELRRNIVITMVAILLFSAPIWWALDREPPYDIVHVDVDPDPAVVGEETYLTFHVKKNRAACSAGEIYQEFKEATSGKLHLYDPIKRVQPPEIIDNKFTRIAKLPVNIAPGVVIYRGAACYTCNPLQAWLRWPVCSRTPETTITVVDRK